MTAPRLEARNASKTFGPATVLSDAHLVVQPGEIHSLVGQNGSGKSTLVKILTGYHSPDSGMTLSVGGRPLALPVQWRAAQAAGISVVHQDMGLLDHLSVSENIGVGGFARSGLTRRIDWKRQDAVAAELLERLQIPVSPRATVGELPPSYRAGVAIARALRGTVSGEGVMILDEATRALPRDELLRIHELLHRVVATGTSVLMVSHNLEEVLTLSHRVTVLRDGRVAGAGVPTSELTEASLAGLMLGKAVGAVDRHLQAPVSEVAARIENLPVDGGSLSITVQRGEVVGLTGLPGTGFEQVPYLLAGAAAPTGGTVTTASGTIDLATCDVAGALAAGIALVPERRVRDGLAVELSVRDNLTLPNIRRRGRPWLVRRGWQDELTERSIAGLDIKTSSGAALVKELSGGNQQKVLFAKWLATDPDLLVLHEPTQAVDVGARSDLLRAICDAAAAGRGVLLVSTEPTDLTQICDRILVLHPGRPPHELHTRDPEDVLEATYSVPTTAGALHG
ncbi:sugar ABC transporter ATP-binding protein [Aeromicrobium wangtongii]|uniref:Sugar ABC transporter ATP-binding protein n=1 Tax=Aeromicrobium wangtongii TaxID=2969247 RepID=A0ABY5M5I7_9ACTN|nr:sugar ABC transporter ATP-binding protein [Aeromicrobium wangtongii]MCD9199809.1 sugar ABC transporter ATP-binding protein [Aeromicrobium wangtongii]UUP13430.1 sugar ABC transporter ATP-binding protein [Aeromicrobium wangtongii]